MGLTIHYRLQADTLRQPRRGGSLRCCVSEPLTCRSPKSARSWNSRAMLATTRIRSTATIHTVGY